LYPALNLQTKNQPTEATATPATAQAEIDQLKQALDEAEEIARNETRAAASKIRRQEDELQELRNMLQLAHNEITVVQSRLERLERPLPTRYTGSSAKKAVHPRYGGRPAPETSPVFIPTTPGVAPFSDTYWYRAAIAGPGHARPVQPNEATGAGDRTAGNATTDAPGHGAGGPNRGGVY
jgi:hypothetical protein